MAERYSRLYSLPENLYIEGAPVIVSAGALLKDNQTGKVLAQLKFKNITPNIIRAIKVSVEAFDVSGVKLQGVDEYQYLDLAAKRDEFFGSKNAFALPDNVTRSFTVNIKSVIFDDGSTWENTGVEISPIVDLRKIDETLGELSEQYKRDTGSVANTLITEDRDLWLCRCAAVNKNNEDICHKCGTEKAKLLDALDIELLKQHKAEHDAAEAKAEAERLAREEEARIERERKAEEEKIRAAANKKKAKKLVAIISPIVVAVAAIVILAIVVLIPNSKYNDAVALMKAEQYEEAIAAFEATDGYKDSIAQITACQYLNATVMMNNGDYEGAIVAFTEIVSYKDSALQIEHCKKAKTYEDAVALQNNGEYVKAIQLYEQLPDYKDTADRIIECQYLRAMAYYDNRNYLDAATVFTEIPDYKDSGDKVYECYYLHAVSKFNTQPSSTTDFEEIIRYFELANDYGDSAEYIEQCNYIIVFLKGEKMLNSINADYYDRIISIYSSLPEDFEYRGATRADRIHLVNYFKDAIQICGVWKLDKNKPNPSYFNQISAMLTGTISPYNESMEISVTIYMNNRPYYYKIEVEVDSLDSIYELTGDTGYTTRYFLQINGSRLVYQVDDVNDNYDKYYYFVK